jgi:chromosome segregation ATPase
MGKKEKRKEKNKDAIFKRKSEPAKKKGAAGKLGKNKKDLRKQWKTLQKEYMELGVKYQGVEGQAADLLEHISQLQRESREIKSSLATEIETTLQARDRLDSLETREEADQEGLIALNRQLERQAGLVDEIKARLETVDQLASQSESLRQQIEYLQAGKAEMEPHIGKLVTEEEDLKSENQGFASSIGNLSSKLDDANLWLQEGVGRNQVIETWMEKLSRADSDLSAQMGQQQGRMQGLVDRAERLDQTARESTDSYRALQDQVRDLSGSLIAAEKHLAGKDAELEQKSQRLDSEYQLLAAKHGWLTGGVLVVGILFLVVGIGYWVGFNRLDDRTIVSLQQIERISERVEQQQSRLADQEQQFSALKERGGDVQGLVTGDWNARFERISQNHDAMDTSMKGFAEEQNEIKAKFLRYGEQQDEVGRQLEQTHSLLAELAAGEDERQTEAKQQQEKLRLVEKRLQQTQAQVKAASAPGTVGLMKDSGWLQGLNPKHYTIQLIAAYDAATVSRIAAREDLQESVAIYKGEFKQRDWYMLLYGDFSSVREAKLAIQDLPEDLRANGPWVRNLSSVQRSLAERE